MKLISINQERGSSWREKTTESEAKHHADKSNQLSYPSKPMGNQFVFMCILGVEAEFQFHAGIFPFRRIFSQREL